MTRALTLIVIVLSWVAAAAAQQTVSPAIVVQNCGDPTLASGGNAVLYVDTTGKLCTSGSGGGGGSGGDVNVTGSTSTTVVMQNAAATTGNGTVLNVDGKASVALTVIIAGTSATVQFEAQNDGSNWVSFTASRTDSASIASSVSTAGTTGWQASVTGFKQIRARISACSSCTVTVTGTTVPLGGGAGGGANSVTAVQPTGSNLHIVCDSSTCGLSVTDNAAFTAASGAVTPTGGFYHATRDTLTDGRSGAIAINANRATLVQLEDSSKNAVGSTSNALDVNLKSGATIVAQGSTSSGQSGTLIQGAVTTNAPAYLNTQTSPLSLDTTGNARTTNPAINTVAAAVGTSASLIGISVAGNARIRTGVNPSGSIYAADTSVSAIGGTTVVTGGVNGLLAVGGNAASGATDAGNPVKVGGVYNSTLPVLTTGQRGDFQVDASGQLRVQPPLITYNATQPTVSNGGTTDFQVTSRAALIVSTGVDAFHMTCDSGCSGSVAPSDNTAFTAGTTSMGTAGGFYHSTRDTITDGRAAAIALNANRAQLVQLEDSSKNAINATSNAMNVYLSNGTRATPILENALSTTVQTVVGAAAALDSYYCYNPNTSQEYVQLFDISGTVTLGVSTPKWSIAIPAAGGANLSGANLGFSNAIKVAATTTATGSTAPTTALDCNFGYR